MIEQTQIMIGDVRFALESGQTLGYGPKRIHRDPSYAEAAGRLASALVRR
jgi:hypothetical protein